MELEIILAVIGSNAVFSFIQFLISRHDRLVIGTRETGCYFSEKEG